MNEPRFCVIRQPDGIIVVVPDRPGDERVLYDLGVDPLAELPAEPLTSQELNAWLSTADIPGLDVKENPPLRRSPGEVLDRASLRYELHPHTVEGEAPSFIVEVQNTGTVPVRKFCLRWDASYETPQMPADPTALSPKSGLFELVFRPMEPDSNLDPFRPGETRRFLFNVTYAALVLNTIASLSPDRYGIAFCSGGRPFYAAGGGEVGSRIEELLGQ